MYNRIYTNFEEQKPRNTTEMHVVVQLPPPTAPASKSVRNKNIPTLSPQSTTRLIQEENDALTQLNSSLSERIIALLERMSGEYGDKSEISNFIKHVCLTDLYWSELQKLDQEILRLQSQKASISSNESKSRATETGATKVIENELLKAHELILKLTNEVHSLNSDNSGLRKLLSAQNPELIPSKTPRVPSIHPPPQSKSPFPSARSFPGYNPSNILRATKRNEAIMVEISALSDEISKLEKRIKLMTMTKSELSPHNLTNLYKSSYIKHKPPTLLPHLTKNIPQKPKKKFYVSKIPVLVSPRRPVQLHKEPPSYNQQKRAFSFSIAVGDTLTMEIENAT